MRETARAADCGSDSDRLCRIGAALIAFVVNEKPGEMTLEKCVACQFYDRNEAHPTDKGLRWGKCRRTGPIVHPVSAVSNKAYMVEGIWPHVRDDDWCGEWEAKRGRIDSRDADPRNLLMQTAPSPARVASLPSGSLMMPAADTPAPAVGRFGSD